MKKEKVLSLVLALCMVLAVIPTAALAAETKPTSGKCGENATWNLDANGTLTISGTGAMDDYNTYTDRAPWPFETIHKVVIEDGISQIGTHSFVSRKNIISVSIPNSVTSIGDSAFSSCSSLTSVTIPSSVEEIGEYAFSGCTGLTGVTISSGVKVIGGRAFWNCTSLTSVTIPESVVQIEYGAFNWCESLTSVTIPGSVTKIGSSAFYGTPWQSKQGDFPVVNGILLDYLGNDCEVTIPDGVKTLPAGVFGENFKLTRVTIPSSVTAIKGNVFNNCQSLTSIQVDPNNPNYTSVDGVLFTKSLKTLVAYPAGKAGPSYSIPNSVTEIEHYAFARASLTNVTIPDGVTSIGDFAFAWCFKLTSVTIPGSVTSMGFRMFYKSGLRSTTIKDGVTSIGAYAFSECFSLAKVTIPSSVTNIGTAAFWQCFALKSITIPDSVTTIEGGAFAVTNLNEVYYGGSKDQWNKIKINNDSDGNASLLSATIHYNTTIPSTPTTPDKPAEDVAHASAQTVTVDGKPVEFQMYALKDASGNDTNYIKLRDMACVLNGTKAQFNVGYDTQDKTITATTGIAYKENGTEMTATFGGADKEYVKTMLTIQLDGKPVQLEAITLTDSTGGGYNYCRVRDLGQLLNFNVKWDGGVVIETDKPYSG